jgi:hypothetical protein
VSNNARPNAFRYLSYQRQKKENIATGNMSMFSDIQKPNGTTKLLM